MDFYKKNFLQSSQRLSIFRLTSFYSGEKHKIIIVAKLSKSTLHFCKGLLVVLSSRVKAILSHPAQYNYSLGLVTVQFFDDRKQKLNAETAKSEYYHNLDSKANQSLWTQTVFCTR